MDSIVKLYLERAENEIILTKTNFEISIKDELKNFLKIPVDRTFFADVISESYYAINVKTKPPEEHKKTYEEFKKFVDSGEIDIELLNIYKSETEKAAVLLKIFQFEKWKRGRFTYDVNSNANIPYAKESVENAIKFVSIIKSLVEEQ